MEVERFSIDPCNPGEALACAGLAALVARTDPGATTGFKPSGRGWVFELAFPEQRIASLSDLQAGDDESLLLGDICLDWWQRGYGLNQPFKFWAGQQTAKSVLTNLLTASRDGQPRDWLDFQAPTTGRLGVDPQGSWNALELGWSPNEHQDIQYLCRPFVELLAFIGLQHFPVQGQRDTGFRYSLWPRVPLQLAILAFAGSSIHSLGRWQTEIGSAGSNKILKSAYPIGEDHERD